MSPVGFDHVAWLWLQGSGQTDSAWFLSALCLSKFSPKLNSGANYESVKLFFFQLYFTRDAQLKDFKRPEGNKLHE